MLLCEDGVAVGFFLDCWGEPLGLSNMQPMEQPLSHGNAFLGDKPKRWINGTSSKCCSTITHQQGWLLNRPCPSSTTGWC